MRWTFRLPILLYRLHLGWLLGERFLMLTHIGRRSGKRRRVVVEVVDHDKATDTYYVASGWGEKSDWFRNIQKNPEAAVHVGRRHLATLAERLSADDAAKRLVTYALEHPFAFGELSLFMAGERLNATPDDARRLAGKIPLVALRPKPSS
jgi:deazaflavin-dependent oxidoreductase (nitroreductase family)